MTSLQFPPGFDPMGRDPSAVSIRTPLAVDNKEDDIPEVPSPDAFTPPELGAVPDEDVWPAATVDPSPYSVNADGPPAPLEVRPDASDEIVIYTMAVPAGTAGEPILLVNRDRARRRLVITAATAGTVYLGHAPPADRAQLGMLVGAGAFPVEIYTWAEVWAWTPTAAVTAVTVAVLAERDRDQRNPRASAR